MRPTNTYCRTTGRHHIYIEGEDAGEGIAEEDILYNIMKNNYRE